MLVRNKRENSYNFEILIFCDFIVVFPTHYTLSFILLWNISRDIFFQDDVTLISSCKSYKLYIAQEICSILGQNFSYSYKVS